MIPKCSMYIFPNGMIWKEGLLAVFWWVARARAERRRGRRATGAQPGEDHGGEVPHDANPPAALLTGGVSGLAPPRRADGVPGGLPLACARPSRSTQAAADGDSLLYPVVSARDPLRQLLGCLSVRCAKIYASSRQCSYVLGLKLRQND